MNDEPVVLRGVIDSLEADWAVIALDDQQRLDWPRERLAEDAAEGMAVVVSLEKAAEIEAQEMRGTWKGVIALRSQAEGRGVSVQLGKQSLGWPEIKGFSSGDAVVVRMEVDAGDTARRRQQVQDLVDDLFG